MMNDVEIIAVTMNQIDFSLVESMNIRTDAIIANQCGKDNCSVRSYDGFTVKMISSSTKGVGVNRNLGLCYSTGKYLMMADEDIRYVDEMPQIVKEAFDSNPKADVIIFGTELADHGKVYETRKPKSGKIPIYKSLKYGTYSIAIRRSSFLKSNLHFAELFGGGCLYSHGEDSDFIWNCYKNKLNVYGCDKIIGCTSKDVSSCFTGYDRKYFYDTGALARNTFGVFSVPYIIYMAYRTKTRSELKSMTKIKLMFSGFAGYCGLKKYEMDE